MPRCSHLLLPAFLLAAACSSESPAGGQAAAASSNATYELFFTNPLPDMLQRGVLEAGRSNASGHTWSDLANVDVAGGRELSARLIELIERADGPGCSVLVADYDFNIEPLAQAMARAKGRGCDVRFVTDGDTVAKSKHEADSNGRVKDDATYPTAFAVLNDANVEVHHDGKRGAIMHDKFAVVGDSVWTGSWNFSDDDEHRFWNNAVVLHSPEAAKLYTASFNAMWARFGADGSVGPQKFAAEGHTFPLGSANAEVYFPSGEKAASRLAELLESATKSIHLLAFQFTHPKLTQIVVDKARGGVDVRGVWENSGACRGAYRELTKLDDAASPRFLRWRFGPKDFMHEKVFVIDGRFVAFGSFNFSLSADGANDENLLVVDDPAIAATFERRYELVAEATALSPATTECGGKSPEAVEASSSEP